MNHHQLKTSIAPFLLFICSILLTYQIRAEAKGDNYHSHYTSGVTSIIQSHRYIQQTKALLYWHISPFYISQLTDSSCSLASATMVLNAIKSQTKDGGMDGWVTQDELLNKVNDSQWHMGVRQGGEGVTLDAFKTLMEKSLQAYGIKHVTVKAVHLKDHSKQELFTFRQTLMASERTAKTLIIVNFDQKLFTGDMSEGHFSPIGAYDSTTKRVLIMDTDRKYVEPYWVPEKLLLDSMATPDHDSGHTRGYLVMSVH